MNTLTKEQILFYLHKFRSLNPKQLDHRRRLIDSFVNSIYLYDDRMIITFNYKEGAKTITFAEIENSVNSSDLSALPAPKVKAPFMGAFIIGMEKGTRTHLNATLHYGMIATGNHLYFDSLCGASPVGCCCPAAQRRAHLN